MKRYDAVIVGAGHGGAQAAVALRQNGFSGSICMLGKESVPPYERPPLSKEYLAREKPFERIQIRPESFWADKQIHLMLGAEVIAVDSTARVVTLRDGEAVAYGDLIWSAGGIPRKLTCSGADLGGVHVIREKADVDGIMRALDQGARRAVVVGGGYIGLEAAAVLSKLGCQVVLIEALERVLARVAGEELSRFFESEHRAHGIDVRLGVTVERLEDNAAKGVGVKLSDGKTISCDLVIVGIGIEPCIAPLAAAGARVSNGVEVDANCCTSLPHVYAIGDCAAHDNAFADGAKIRLESVQNANDMAITAAKSICGKAEPYHAIPWFWSNQFDLKLQTVGLSRDHDATVIRGDPALRSFSVVYLKDRRVVALDCVNAMKDYVQGRRLVEAGAAPDRRQLADPLIPLKELIAPPVGEHARIGGIT